jgi:hypothetical protein
MGDMSFDFLTTMNPVVVAELAFTIIAVILMLRLTGFSLRSKGKGEGFSVGFNSIDSKLEKAIAALRDDIADIKKVNSRQDRQLKEMQLDGLKKAVYNESLPMNERLWQGARYLKRGGNGDTAKYINEKLVPHDRSFWELINSQIEEEI